MGHGLGLSACGDTYQMLKQDKHVRKLGEMAERGAAEKIVSVKAFIHEVTGPSPTPTCGGAPKWSEFMVAGQRLWLVKNQ